MRCRTDRAGVLAERAGKSQGQRHGVGFYHPELTKYAGGKSRIYGGGNGFWIKHANGSIVEYAHFQPGSVPAFSVRTTTPCCR